jgi:hypothetical protein
MSYRGIATEYPARIRNNAIPKYLRQKACLVRVSLGADIVNCQMMPRQLEQNPLNSDICSTENNF